MVNQEHLAKNQWSPVHGDYLVHVTSTSVLSNLSDLWGITDTVMWTEDLRLLGKHALVEMSMDNIDEVVKWAIAQVASGSPVSIVTPHSPDTDWFSVLVLHGFIVADDFAGEVVRRDNGLEAGFFHDCSTKVVLWYK